MSNPKSGMAVIHRSGSAHILDRRKIEGGGWWLMDRAGLSDDALASDNWRLLDEEALRLLFPNGEGTEQ